MEIFPAIDLRGGSVVRLRYGDPGQQTIFDNDPEAVARRWAAAGARWLHVVNLDGALEEPGSGAALNLAALAQIIRVGPRVQFGGGLRSLAAMVKVLELGVTRIVLATAALQQPALLQQAIEVFGAAKIVVGLDARNGRVQIRGWQEDSGLDVIAAGRLIRAAGITTALHTDIGRDGDLTGVNATASSQLAQATGLQVIASGGVATIEDVRRLRGLPGIAGVIIGRALYEKQVDLEQVLAEVAGGK
jgi:phosphoribosylformimino-5-aminoimidazole carboxamide ribotide isomerase